jgi:hypothetical protein
MGDGPVAAALEPRPADLTRLRERYGEASPLRRTIAAIDGRQAVRAHGNSAMPVWGEIIEREMKRDEGAQDRLASSDHDPTRAPNRRVCHDSATAVAEIARVLRSTIRFDCASRDVSNLISRRVGLSHRGTASGDPAVDCC